MPMTASELGTGKSAACPEAPQVFRADFVQGESAHPGEAHPARERLGDLAKQLRRGAPQDEKARRPTSSTQQVFANKRQAMCLLRFMASPIERLLDERPKHAEEARHEARQ